ncbi:MAG: ferrochelatase [Candidatus Omnitrophica bacterium]|nr:ferrochelatase [Candidatus Omnitrophota bacterium]
MTKLKNGVLLINLGTPDSPSIADVRKYLREFLMDARVMDIPFWSRFLLVHLVIAPFRAPQSAKAYRMLWTPQGSPLKFYGNEVQKLLQQALGEGFQVELAMRYQNPGIKDVLSRLKTTALKSLTVIPLYPQYAGASSGSTIQEVMKEIKKWEVIPDLKLISRFFDDPLFIKAFAQLGRKYMALAPYDHYLFSYHGLPQKQVLKSSCECRLGDCCMVYGCKNRYCYRAQCFETTRLLAEELGIPKGDYTACFQSRLGSTPWIKPHTDETIKRLAQKGIKSVLVFSPSFVADCLETTVEIGYEYKKLFFRHGGRRWQMVESLNTQPVWVDCLKELIINEYKH